MRIPRTALIGVPILLLLPLAVRFAFPAAEKYYLHLLIQILIWSFIYTGWSLMGVDQRRVYLVTSGIGGGLAGLAAALMVLQYDIYPQIGLQFGPLIFMICVLGGLGSMIGGFIAAFIISEFIAVGGSCFATEWGYAIAFLFFMVVIFIRPQGLFGGKS